ncbi:MAG TPA: aldehyde ferredoxin oxidoreductase family protein [Spirochaetota bacterium]|nr:aldehyde ferredoxin oxidoreductase family protein [Spirochaetota bacterium]HNT10566.1 aldehyde ferredoxin oxidoreductase family protein [Spirochaetota bacterium]
MASAFKGYMGRIMDVDLSNGRIGEYSVSDADRERFIGGRFLSTKILWDMVQPGIDPLSPENVLVVMTSPLTGTGAPCSSRYDISAKSPLTGAIGHSNSGGNFGINLKRAGWDGIVVRGRSKRPVYLEIDGDTVRIKSASKLWGADTQAAQSLMIGKETRAGAMAIGVAGENLVKFASIVSQERSHGRCGMGAVMGSKNLKGMVARGDRKAELAQPEAYKDTIKAWIKMLQNHPATGEMTPRLGTAGFLTALSIRNALPTKNFKRGSYEDAYLIGGERLADEFLVKNYGCQSCPIRCGRVVELDGKEVKGPEYEILCLLGSNMLINDMPAIIRWNQELDHLGMDAISAGTIMGFAAELNEKGLWKNGIQFGKKDNISKALSDIAHRRGIGKDLAEGVRFLSKKYGGEDFAPHSKGLELAAYEPRASVGHGLGYATASRGACHLDGGYMIYFEVTGPATLDPFHYRSKPAYTVLDQNLLAAISAGGNCLFTSWPILPPILYKLPGHYVLSRFISSILTYSWGLIGLITKLPRGIMRFHMPGLPHSKALNEATGMRMDFGRFYAAGERGYTLERMFNLREGIGRNQDTLSRRFTDEPLLAGNPKSVVRLDKMLPAYYRLRGWDANGVPTSSTLRKLDLAFADERPRTGVR